MTKPSRSGLDCQTESGFSISFYWKQTVKGGVQEAKEEELEGKRKVASRSENRDIKKIPQVAEDLATPGTPISIPVHGHPKAAPLRENLQA